MQEGTVRVGQIVRTNNLDRGRVVRSTGIVEQGSEWFDVELETDGSLVMQNAERLTLISEAPRTETDYSTEELNRARQTLEKLGNHNVSTTAAMDAADVLRAADAAEQSEPRLVDASYLHADLETYRIEHKRTAAGFEVSAIVGDRGRYYALTRLALCILEDGSSFEDWTVYGGAADGMNEAPRGYADALKGILECLTDNLNAREI